MIWFALRWTALGLAVVSFCALIWIRIAPSNPAQWHIVLDVTDPGELKEIGGYRLTIRPASPAQTLADLNAAILQDPDTTVLAGSLADGHITYISRTPRLRFPDYTTVQLNDGTLSLYGRTRFGISDTGVNRARILHWVQTAGLPL